MTYLQKETVRLAYAMANSKGYQKFKTAFRKLLEYERSKAKIYFDILMIVLVLVSVYILIYEVKNPITPWMEWFEYGVVAVFIIEYIARMWIYSDIHRIIIESYEEAQFQGAPFQLLPLAGKIVRAKISYMTSPLAIIDLLAILPSYRPLRILRIFLLFRLFKLFRYAKSINAFVNVLSQKRFELWTLAIFVGFILLTSSAAIYIFEANSNEKIVTFFDAIYWSMVTLSTVGYGDITPQSTPGMIITMLLIVLGVAVLAFLTSIIVSAFTEKLDELKANRVYADLERMHTLTLICGYGRVGEVVAKFLHEDNERIVVVDTDPAKIDLAKERGIRGICGDASQSRFLQRLGMEERVTRVVCATGTDAMNILITLTARNINKKARIIARLDDKQNRKKFLLAGADHAFSPIEVIGVMGVEYVQQPMAYEAIDGMLTGERGAEFEIIRLPEGSSLCGVSVSELALKAQKLILFGIRRGADEAFHFNPAMAFLLEEGDRLMVLGRRHQIERFREKIERSAL